MARLSGPIWKKDTIVTEFLPIDMIERVDEKELRGVDRNGWK
jgi:hypothetical protein